MRPDNRVVDLADRLVQVAKEQTDEPEFTIDVDGALSFDLRLASGLLMFAELAMDGTLDITILDEGRQGTLVVRNLSAATEAQFLEQL